MGDGMRTLEYVMAVAVIIATATLAFAIGSHPSIVVPCCECALAYGVDHEWFGPHVTSALQVIDGVWGTVSVVMTVFVLVALGSST